MAFSFALPCKSPLLNLPCQHRMFLAWTFFSSLSCFILLTQSGSKVFCHRLDFLKLEKRLKKVQEILSNHLNIQYADRVLGNIQYLVLYFMLKNLKQPLKYLNSNFSLLCYIYINPSLINEQGNNEWVVGEVRNVTIISAIIAAFMCFSHSWAKSALSHF